MDIKKLFIGTEKLDKKSITFLLNAISENNLPGFDYIEFKQSLNGLLKLNMDVQTAIRSAFTTASTMGLTKANLLSSADHYVKVLKQEKSQFDNALSKQMAQKVDGKKEEKEVLSKKIEQYKEKIRKLEQEIIHYQEKIDNADSEIAESRKKIEQTKDKFETAFNFFLTEIDKDVEAIKETI